MTTNKKKMKAKKHLSIARSSLDLLHYQYVLNERNSNKMLDIKMIISGVSIREEKRKEIRGRIQEVKERIAKWERIAY